MSIDEHEPTKEPQELSPEVIQVLAEVQGIFLQCLRAISETTAMLKVMQEFYGDVACFSVPKAGKRSYMASAGPTECLEQLS